MALKSRCGPADQIQMSFDTTAPEKRGALSKIVAALLIIVVSGALTARAVAVFPLHLSIRPVLSGSMRPTYAPGWAIVTRPTPTSTSVTAAPPCLTSPSSCGPFSSSGSNLYYFNIWNTGTTPVTGLSYVLTATVATSPSACPVA